MMAVASLEYLAGHGEPRTRRDLRRHRCLLGYTGDLRSGAEAGPKALKAPGTLGSPGRARLKAAPAPHMLLEHFGIAHIAAQGFDRSVARLVYHLEKIDALRLAALVI